MLRVFIVSSIFLLLANVMSAFSAERYKFLYYTDVDGLPRNITTCIDRDKYGYVWIGTDNGIARYDGNSFSTYPPFQGLSITCLCIDSQNTVWLGTNIGLFTLNRLTDIFEKKAEGFVLKILEYKGEIYFLQTQQINKLSKLGITTIKSGTEFADFCISNNEIFYSESSFGVKYIGLNNDGSIIPNRLLSDKNVSVIAEIEGNIFFGCRNGQLFVKTKDGMLRNIAIKNHHNFKCIKRIDREIWLATDGNGIIILDDQLNYSRSLSRNQNMTASISSNSIYDVFQGYNKEIWIASYGAGITRIIPDHSLFINIIPEKGNNNSLVASEGVATFEKNGLFYFGTNYGMSIWNEKTNIFKNFSMDELKKDLKGTKVLAITADDKNNIWVGTYDGLLGKYNSEYKLIKTINPSSNNPDEMQQIVLMHNFRNKNLLIGTQYQNRCLLNFNLTDETINAFELYFKGSKQTQFQISSIRENKNHKLVALISDIGLFDVNLDENILENNYSEINKHITFWITDFHLDKNGNAWLTTSSEGLVRISADGSESRKWAVKEGLPNNSLVRIESLDDQYLWISTIAGICRFEIGTGQVINFNHRNGLSSNEFIKRISAITNDGRIIFGSVAGFTIVNPTKVATDTSKAEVVISDITFQNQSIRTPNGKQFLTAPLEETKIIRLPYSRNSFTIHFFTRDKDSPKFNNYNYRLLGLEKDWTYLGETNHINYTNLSAGTYSFEVKSAAKMNAESNTPTCFTIQINPPWYMSWYAYIAYFLMFSLLIMGSMFIYTNRVQLKKELEISEYKIQKEHELTEKKLAFFTNISHDLKTPLTLIDAPVNDLLQSKNLDDEQTNKLLLIRRNSRRLYKLIIDLLDFRKLTEKQFTLEISETNISELIDNVYLAFQEECKSKSIIFSKKILVSHPVYVDAAKIEKILWNLLSNAVKFTGKNGEINLGIYEIVQNEKIYLLLEVKDSGIGISEKDQTKIFDPFYQVRNNKSHSQYGTGIGLSIVKDLVALHHGETQIESSPGIGTTFRMLIPMEKEQYRASEYGQSEISVPNPTDVDQVFDKEAVQEKNCYNRPGILIVEDNEELREYLAIHFKKNFKVFQAEDGIEGLKQAVKINPDLILTDVQMPNMNGYDFCKEIRAHFDTSHIPVVMLTANSAVEQQIEGLNTGADAYITKPFDIKLLDSLLNSVLENRRKLRVKFLGADPVIENLLPHKDIDFTLELKTFIEKELANQELNVDSIAEHFSVSRTQLNLKVKSLTGLTPNILIKTIRLKKAYQLIRVEGMRVSEAAYQTGFTDPNYFTTCFKKEFGENPSQINID